MNDIESNSEKYLDEAEDLFIKDVERNQNEGTVIHTKYSRKCIKCQVPSWKKIPGFGIFLLLAHVILSNVVNVIVKDITGVAPESLLFFRSVIMLGVSMPWAVCVNKPPFSPDMQRKEQVMLLFRGLIGFANVLASYYSLRFLDIGDQKMLASSRPIWVILFSRAFLNESCGLFEGILVIFMLSGLILVIKPNVLFGADLGSTYDNPALLSAAAVLFTTALSSNTSIILRKLRKEHVASLTAANQLLYLIQSFALLWLGGFELNAPDVKEKFLIFLMAIIVLSYSMIHVLALKIVMAGIASMITSCLDLLVALMVQIFYYNKSPDFLTWVGVSLVGIVCLASCARRVVQEIQEQREERTSDIFPKLQTLFVKLKTWKI